MSSDEKPGEIRRHDPHRVGAHVGDAQEGPGVVGRDVDMVDGVPGGHEPVDAAREAEEDHGRGRVAAGEADADQAQAGADLALAEGKKLG